MNIDIAGVLERHARFLGKKPALIDGASITYGQLWSDAGAIATELTALGLEPGDRVALAYSPSAEYATLIVGLLRAGLVAAPVNTWLAPGEIAGYLDRLSPRVIIADEEHREKVEASGTALLLATRAADRWQIARSGPRRAGARPQPLCDEALIIGTGGTTGLPKGAVFSRRAVSTWAVCAAFAQQLRSADVEMFGSPFFHSTILTGLLTPLGVGCTVRIIRRFDVPNLLEAVVRDGGNRLSGAPTMLHRALTSAIEDPHVWDSIRVVQFGSTKCPPGFVDLLRAGLPNASLITGYGTTEYGPVTRVYDPDFSAERNPGVGRPVPWADVKIFDRANNTVTDEVDVEGEIVAACPWQMTNYVGAEADAPEAILPSGHIHSGDIGRFDEDGYLHFVGRYKEIVITGGENVFPGEVEAVLERHPAVMDVAVYGVDDPVWGERVEAAVVLRDGSDLSIAELRDFCRAELAGFKIPKTIVKLDSLPLTPNMKVDKRLLTRSSGDTTTRTN